MVLQDWTYITDYCLVLEDGHRCFFLTRPKARGSRKTYLRSNAKQAESHAYQISATSIKSLKAARGDRDAGTILGAPASGFDFEFQVENFAFHDMSTSKQVGHNLFTRSCEPGDENIVELHASKPRVTRALLDQNDPLADPAHILVPGHVYRVTLKPQTIRCWTCGVDELLAKRQVVPPSDGEEVPGYTEYKYPDSRAVTLASKDELILKVDE